MEKGFLAGNRKPEMWSTHKSKEKNMEFEKENKKKEKIREKFFFSTHQ